MYSFHKYWSDISENYRLDEAYENNLIIKLVLVSTAMLFAIGVFIFQLDLLKYST